MRLTKVFLISFIFLFIFGCSSKKREYLQNEVSLELNDSLIRLNNLRKINSITLKDVIEESPKDSNFSFIFTKIGFEQNELGKMYRYYLDKKNVPNEILFIDFYIDKNVEFENVVIKKEDVKNIGVYYLINKKIEFKYYQVPVKLLNHPDNEPLTCTNFLPYLYAQPNISNNNFLFVRAHLKYSKMPKIE